MALGVFLKSVSVCGLVWFFVEGGGIGFVRSRANPGAFWERMGSRWGRGASSDSVATTFHRDVTAPLCYTTPRQESVIFTHHFCYPVMIQLSPPPNTLFLTPLILLVKKWLSACISALQIVNDNLKCQNCLNVFYVDVKGSLFF